LSCRARPNSVFQCKFKINFFLLLNPLQTEFLGGTGDALVLGERCDQDDRPAVIKKRQGRLDGGGQAARVDRKDLIEAFIRCLGERLRIDDARPRAPCRLQATSSTRLPRREPATIIGPRFPAHFEELKRRRPISSLEEVFRQTHAEI
jgi:hypothetical protein